MADTLKVQIFVSDGTVHCNPPHVVMRRGQSIEWLSPTQADLLIDFGDKSPFQTHRFRSGDAATVRQDAEAATFEPTITVDSVNVSKTVGGVEVRHPDVP